MAIYSSFRDLYNGNPNSGDHDPLFIADTFAITLTIKLTITFNRQ